jgi:AcrR family transcriptional regulator
MSRLADAVGVSRQTVYNEIGSKPNLAEAMVLAELGRFLAVVDTAFDAHPDDLVAAVRAAVRGVLELARRNSLLHAVVSATHGAGTDLLPPLTTHADALYATARRSIATQLELFDAPLDDRQRGVLIDVIVRVVLSHVMHPSADADHTADDMAWLVGRVIRPQG